MRFSARFCARVCTRCLLLFALWGLAAPASAQSEAELQAEQEFYDLLMMLDEFGASLPEEAFDIETPELDREPGLEEELEGEDVDDTWVLAFLSLLDQEQAIEAERALAELEMLAEHLQSAAEGSAGRLEAALEAAAADLERLVERAERLQPIEPPAARRAIGEAQRVLALYYCQQANRDAAGSLANPDPSMRQRLTDLTAAARLTLAASRTISYRLPPEAKRSLASAIALSNLFPERDVRLRLVRERAREIERALGDLGNAIRRAAR